MCWWYRVPRNRSLTETAYLPPPPISARLLPFRLSGRLNFSPVLLFSLDTEMKPGASSLQALSAPLRRVVVSRSIPAAAARPVRPFSSSFARFNEGKQDGGNEGGKKEDTKKDDTKKEKKRTANDEPGPPQSPFKVFLRVFREEIDKNQGWQQNVKQLQGDVDKLADSAAMKTAREAYERTRVG